MPPQDEPGSSVQPPHNAQVYGHVPNPAHLTDGSNSEHEDQDIYRGIPPAFVPPRTPSPAPTTSSSSSTSSASVFRGRLGAISAGVEHAISRWARAWLSSSSLSSASSTSYASSVSHGKSQTTRRRKRRPRSIATTIHNAKSEQEIAARIRARQDLRTIPRDFVFYTPKLVPATAKSQAAAERRAARIALVNQDPILRTTDLDEVTARLNVVLRERAKAHRVRSDPLPSASSTGSMPSSSPPFRAVSHPLQDYMLSDESAVARSTPTLPTSSSTSQKKEKEGKGKQRPPFIEASSSTMLPPPKTTTIQLEPQRVAKAWWLDVSSPSWEDMCQIGKLLGLHPLTLEDILTQDPREKLELFPRLGYYFLSFRAIESRKTRDRLRNMLSEDAANADDQGIVGEVNMYLIVFREGICSFHFADIEEHIDRVRHRIMLLDESSNASADWIAHGLLDSIVDSYFPYLEVIEKEASEMDRRIFSAGERGDAVEDIPSTTRKHSSAFASRRATLNEKSTSADLDEKEPASLPQLTKATSVKSNKSRLRFVSPTKLPMMMRRAKRAIVELFASIPRFKAVDTKAPGYHHPANTITRMARIRRLVTSLARFLAVKSEVVAQVKKRLLTKGEWGLGTGMEDDLDIFVYMGDVQDHILTLQQSLAHYERMLSQSHPTFLSQLRFSVNRAKSDSDKAVMFLTAISLGVVCVQTLIGLFSMNAEVPHNNIPGTKYNGFAIVLSGSVVIVIVYSSIVRYWWIQAKRRRLNLKS
uniref:Magnesium transporter ALR2 n=1 Tax=Ganoderma boninense TaxID=34458 RepID=A0A5K1JWJ1_9APHY|nr:Magnesium transporter ALR2 [Ganoderma boninense]